MERKRLRRGQNSESSTMRANVKALALALMATVMPVVLLHSRCHADDPKLDPHVPGLLKQLADEHAWLRGPTKTVPEIMNRPKPSKPTAEDKLYDLGPTVIPALVDRLADPDVAMCVSVKNLLDRFGKKAVPALIEAARNNDISTRVAAVETLGMIGERAKDAVPTLIPLTRHWDRSMRLAAMDALACIGDERAIPTLFDIAGDAQKDGG